MITIDHQIAEVRRELALRSRVFPSFIARGKMRQGEADLHVSRMEAVLKTLEWLSENQATIKDNMPGWVQR